MAAARVPLPQVRRRHLVPLLRKARQPKPVQSLRLLCPSSAGAVVLQAESSSFVWGGLSLINQAGFSVVIRMGVAIIL